MVKVLFAKGSLVGVIVVVFAMVMAGSAEAKEVDVFSSKFGAGELSLTAQSGLAIDQATGEVYVGDTGNDRIAEYGASGEPKGTLATVTEPTFLALDNSSDGSSGDIYVVERGNQGIAKVDPSGAPVTTWGTAGRMEGFGEILGIAVDPSGNLFVVGTGAVLHEFTPAGSLTGQCTIPPLLSSLHSIGLAVDAKDDLYLSYGQRDVTAKVSSGCQVLSEEFEDGWGGERNGFAVDESDNSVFSTRGDDIEHFSSTGGHIERNIGVMEGFLSTEGSGPRPNQLAVRSDNQTVYVAEQRSGYIGIFSVVNVEPPHVTVVPPTSVSGTTAHFQAEINPEAPVNDPPAWEVHYSFHCVPRCTGAELSGTVLSKSEPETVKATAEHLLPGTEYEVYITAENVGGVARAPEEPEVGLPFQTEAIAPSIEGEEVAEASESAGTIAAVIDPGGTETGYRVQYVTRAQFEASGFTEAKETPEAVVTRDAEETLEEVVTKGEGVAVAPTVTGLSSSTSYVARLIATNTVGGVLGEPVEFTTQEPLLAFESCANEVFRTGAGKGLADCRAYEMASPADKNGGSVEAVPGSVQAPGEGGGAVTFFSQAGLPGGVGAQDYPTFVSTRSDGSWIIQGMLPSQSLGEFGEYLGMTPDGRYAITEATLKGEGAGVFARDMSTGEVITVVPYDPGCSGTGYQCFTLVGASADGSMIFLETELELDKESPTTLGPRNVYAWDRETGKISLVGVNQSGERLSEGAFAGPYDWPEGNLAKGGSSEHFYVGALNAVARDGSEVVYTERGDKGHGQLYARVGLGGPSARSVKVSAYAAGRAGPELPAAFLGATPEGQFIFFKSEAELTSDSYSGEGTESLYRYDVLTGKLIDVTSEAKEKFQDGPGVEGMLGTSESGRVVYFVAKAKLTTKPGPLEKTAVSGEANLYRWEEGASPAISFITTLQDGPSYGFASVESDSRDWSPSIVTPGDTAAYKAKTARISADGGTVVFSSRRSLTGTPNMASGCNAEAGNEKPAPCAEFFRYSAATRTLDCVSCNTTGAAPLNGATIGTGYINAADTPLAFADPVLPRNLSADGDRFFFQTPDSLVAADVNRPGCKATTEEMEKCLDVYEWEATGTGSCTTATTNGGCVYLISSGQGEEASYFADADPEGKNVYFFTASQLVPADRDKLYDVYDASENGGLASQHETPPVRCGSQQTCQGSPAGPEAAVTLPGTLNFVGPGDQTFNLVLPGGPKPAIVCKKGLVRKQDKCVRKTQKKKSKKKNTKKSSKKSGGRPQKRRAGHGKKGGKK